jgi:signal peptidase I
VGQTLKSIVRELLQSIIPAILIAIVLNLFIVQPTKVRGESMEPTLHTDEYLLVEKISYRLHEPRRGDVVVFKYPRDEQENFIKRVIAVPGDTVEIDSGRVSINGQSIVEPYLLQLPRESMPLTEIPTGKLFVLGDNRLNSNDSRSFGMVTMSEVLGRAWLRYWPIDQFILF